MDIGVRRCRRGWRVLLVSDGPMVENGKRVARRGSWIGDPRLPRVSLRPGVEFVAGWVIAVWDAAITIGARVVVPNISERNDAHRAELHCGDRRPYRTGFLVGEGCRIRARGNRLLPRRESWSPDRTGYDFTSPHWRWVGTEGDGDLRLHRHQPCSVA